MTLILLDERPFPRAFPGLSVEEIVELCGGTDETKWLWEWRHTSGCQIGDVSEPMDHLDYARIAKCTCPVRTLALKALFVPLTVLR